MNVEIKKDERIDDLQLKGYRIIQNPDRFCFGIDAVLLSTFARIKARDKAIDLCAGNAIVSILLAGKTEGKDFTAVEIQEDNVDIAKRSVALNDLEDNIKVYGADLNDLPKDIEYGKYQVVTVNPPYMAKQHGLENNYDAKTIARHEVLCSLEDVIEKSSKLLCDKGRFYMVHKPFRLAEIFQLMMKYKIEPKKMKMVQSYIDKEPNMVLIEGIKGAKSRIIVEPPLIVYNKDGSYTKELLSWYGDMK